MTSPTRLAPVLSPHGRLSLAPDEDALELDPALAARLVAAFSPGSGPGLLHLGAREVGTALPPALAYWREIGAAYLTALCTLPDREHVLSLAGVGEPSPSRLMDWTLGAPVMLGAEYVRPDTLLGLWRDLDSAFCAAFVTSGLPIDEFVHGLSPAWNGVGRVHLHLAENRKDPEAPFAFLATYTTRLSAHAQAQHVPLGQALREYSGARERERLLALLVPLQRAAERCDWLKALVDHREIFHPLRWSPAEAARLLRDVATLEQSGLVVRLPASWPAGRPSRPRVTATAGSRSPSQLGVGALLDFEVSVTLDGERLSRAELRSLLLSANGLAFLRGRWVEVDRERIESMLTRLEEAERLAAAGGLTFSEAARMLSRVEVTDDEVEERLDPAWAEVVAGPWLAEQLQRLRSPEGLAAVDPGEALKGTLRPYQQTGVRWLHLLVRLGLGACLADDMGLGKTIQVLALMLSLRQASNPARRPALLVAPASLLGNWVAEVERFAPSLRTLVAHSSALSAADLQGSPPCTLEGVDVVLTSYGTLPRVPWLASTAWGLVVLDEAQAIKNPGARQSRAVKAVRAEARLALTGTPVENRLGDLWSLFDFLNPGLLGSAGEFTRYTKELGKRQNPYGPLRDLVRPYILRRMKTDRSVIADLPDKTEVLAWCSLTKRQAALYEQAVSDLEAALEQQSEGIERRGLVLAALMRFKQICNHPSQWLGDQAWDPSESGKWARLAEIVESIAARQEKVLVFTQFREVTAPLAAYLGGLFGRPGVVLHGSTAVRERQALVRRFQEDDSVPFFVLSLKAGGSGLNLTAASHVVHFDRWWNPAVENQATDRAFRIGQKRNVMVHKFVCRGTVEEKIDALIETKKGLANDLLGGGDEIRLTELPDDEILRLVRLDARTALGEV